MQPRVRVEELAGPRLRQRVVVRGIVQGVGFRPFVYRQARALGLVGWVVNTGDGVTLEAEGTEAALSVLLDALRSEPPPNAVIDEIHVERMCTTAEDAFHVRRSSANTAIATSVPPDFATCAQCLKELFDPADRRFRYPFTSCAHCGPRFSLIERLPYERSRTSMAHFALCTECRAEYEDPGDRRFHAETTACPACGPHLSLWDAAGRPMRARDAALDEAVSALREGRIVAVKGLGGFHLVVDACNERAVERLRERKQRPRKPFAIMFDTLESIAACCDVGVGEAALLEGPQAPIVLVKRRAEPALERPIAAAVAPDNPWLGVMLPFTPLHHLLLTALEGPVVATSGNVSDEPLVFDERDALGRLAGLADLFLLHDRPILRPIDDSVVRFVAGKAMMLRRARGYAPTRIAHADVRGGVLALGGHLKATVATTLGNDIVLSQHLGTLDTPESRAGYERAIDDLKRLHAAELRLLACDMHPDYYSTHHAERTRSRVVRVQHHVAHVSACVPS